MGLALEPGLVDRYFRLAVALRGEPGGAKHQEFPKESPCRDSGIVIEGEPALTPFRIARGQRGSMDAQG